MRNDRFKKKFFEIMKKAPRESELEKAEKAEKKDPDAQDVLNAQALGMYGLIVGISSRQKGWLIMRLSVMSSKKKNLLSKINF
jgi:basic membrane lipoprotein Med (substrate-binding protein (PBP1-ABC) superfamily)